MTGKRDFLSFRLIKNRAPVIRIGHIKAVRAAIWLSMVFASASVHAAGLTVDDFIADPDTYDVAISPNGRYLAEIHRQNEMRLVTIRDLEAEGWPVIGQLGDDVLRAYSVMWANDERLLVHLLVPLNTNTARKEAAKKEDFDLDDYHMASRTISVNREGKDSVELLRDVWRARANWNLSRARRILSEDAKHVLMTAYVKGRLSLYTVNVYDGASKFVVAGGLETIFFLSDKSGRPLYRLDISDYSRKIKIFKFLGGEEWEYIEKIEFKETEDEESDLEMWDLVGLANDGGIFYRKRNRQTGYYEILKRHPKGGPSEVVVSLPDRDVLSLLLDEETHEVTGYRVEEDDVVRERYFNKARQAEYDKLRDKLAKYALHFYSVDREGRRSVISSYGPDFPGTFFVYDHKQDRLSAYGRSQGRLKLEDLGVPAVVTYLTRDKAKIRAYVLLPPGYQPGKSYPMVLLPHGGPHARDYAFYDNFAQFIATRGYIVIQPNFRGSTGYGLEFEKAGYKQWGRLMQDDLDDAVAFMVKKGYADSSRICIVGGSYGGYAALMGLVKSPSIYKCGISINGVTHIRDQAKYFINRYSKWSEVVDRVRETMGDPDIDKDYMNKHSPLLRADEIKSPLLLIAGDRDAIVPFEQSKSLAKALKRRTDFTFLPVKDAGHNVFYWRKDREKVFKAVAEFLQKNL
jgi:dienelactone hydrolase